MRIKMAIGLCFLLLLLAACGGGSTYTADGLLGTQLAEVSTIAGVEHEIGREHIISLGEFDPMYLELEMVRFREIDLLGNEIDISRLSADNTSNLFGTQTGDAILRYDNGRTYLMIDLGPVVNATTVSYRVGVTNMVDGQPVQELEDRERIEYRPTGARQYHERRLNEDIDWGDITIARILGMDYRVPRAENSVTILGVNYTWRYLDTRGVRIPTELLQQNALFLQTTTVTQFGTAIRFGTSTGHAIYFTINEVPFLLIDIGSGVTEGAAGYRRFAVFPLADEEIYIEEYIPVEDEEYEDEDYEDEDEDEDEDDIANIMVNIDAVYGQED